MSNQSFIEYQQLPSQQEQNLSPLMVRIPPRSLTYRLNKEQNNLGSDFAPFETKMRQQGLPDLMIRTFQYYYTRLVAGETGFIASADAAPVDALPEATELSEYRSQGLATLDRAVILKLNGGLGTSMGMNGPKSLLTVKQDMTFLDIIVRQTIYLRRHYNARLPLILMNSFNTSDATLTALANYVGLEQDIPFEFLQHKEPKVDKETFTPVKWPSDPEKEWCPPGHGDLYAALVTSGMLDRLTEAGYEYIFVSNSDNLGATLDINILGYLATEQIPFLMEVADRTKADSKGGHLARQTTGQLILRELAQCPPDEHDLFQDVERYRYFNTNNLWVHLPTLKRVMQEREGVLGLPLIRNEKPVDPTIPTSRSVYQLETAMGSAINIFHNAQAMRVPRERFVPIKKNNDLLLLLSDAYKLTDEYHLVRTSTQAPSVELDKRYYNLIDDLQERFAYGAPSLQNCTSLRVEGNVYFGKDVILEGDVQIVNESNEPYYIADGSIIRHQEIVNPSMLE